MKMEMASSGVRQANDSGSTTPYSKLMAHVDGSSLNQPQPQQPFVAQHSRARGFVARKPSGVESAS